MRPPVAFLQSFAHALATMTLYAPRHPASRQAADRAFQQLEALFSDAPSATFAFLEGTVIYGGRALHELQGWPWATRLYEAKVQRIELQTTATRQSFGDFLADVNAQLLAVGAGAAAPNPPMRRGIRWGQVEVVDEETLVQSGAQGGALLYRVDQEVGVVRGIFDGAATADQIDTQEAEMVVASLSVAMQDSGQFLLPLLQAAEGDDYRTMHAINVAILSMSLGESLGMGAHDVHAVGVSALLHDIGLSKVPKEVLDRPVLSAEDRRLIEGHAELGARLLMGREGPFDHAAVVAYEHHMRPDGTGYPRTRFPLQMHYVSSIVAVADVYDALRTTRPFRPAWEPERALAYIESGAGTKFEAGVARAFATLLRRLELPAVAAG